MCDLKKRKKKEEIKRGEEKKEEDLRCNNIKTSSLYYLVCSPYIHQLYKCPMNEYYKSFLEKKRKDYLVKEM